jgi:hypothetical protein
MSIPSIVKGQYFDVAVDVTSLNLAGVSGYVIICGLTSRGFTHGTQTGDEYVRDCSNPEDVPVRVVNVTGESWDISGSGLHNRKQQVMIDAMVGKSLPVRFIEGEPSDDAVFIGYYDGKFVLESYAVQGADGANVTSTFAWKSDGIITLVTGAPSA